MDEEDKQDLKSIGLYYFDLPVGGGGFWPPIIEDDFGGVLIKWFVNSSRDAQIGRLYGFDDIESFKVETRQCLVSTWRIF